MKNNNYKVGLYLRLSRDDNNSDSESMSISNQRSLLTEYVEERGWQVEEIYADDGISGTTFNRPSFLKMIEDIKKKRINMVVVKDMSRFGRNYVKVGEYTDFFFPEHKVRFISISEGIDSEKDNDIAAFLNVFHEHYAKDTSRKIKVVKHAQMRKGKFIGSQPPMGYIKSPEDKHQLIIDEVASEYIKRMFYLYSIGNTARYIADEFNKKGIPSPREYFFKLVGKPNPYISDSTLWGSSTIMRMLKNQVYIGHMCQGKRKNRSFKLKERDVVPQEDWIVVKNTHEAIIDDITWRKVQELMKLNKVNKRPRATNKTHKPSIFAGKIVCADCKAIMSYTYSKSNEYKKYYKYRCSTYNNQGKAACSYHAILEDELIEVVLNDIRKMSNLMSLDSDYMLKMLLELNGKNKANSHKQLAKKIQEENNALKSVSQKIDVLLEEKMEGSLSSSMFKKLMHKYECLMDEHNEKLIELKSELAIVKDDTKNIKELIEAFKNHIYIEELDRETVCELIDHITVYKKIKVGKEYEQKIVISYNLFGEFKEHHFEEFFDYITRHQLQDNKKDQSA